MIMGKLTSLTLPLGSSTKRMALTQKHVDTLISVHHDSAITEKHVSGYVSKSTITKREYYLLTQLGLDVAYDTLQDDTWSLNASNTFLKDGESAVITIDGSVLTNEAKLTIDSVVLDFGSIGTDTAKGMLTLEGNELVFKASTTYTDFIGDVVIKATTQWGASRDVTIKFGVANKIPTVCINPSGYSAALQHSGDTGILDDYIKRCKCYVFTADGSKMAEIKSATFAGAYSGMTEGRVTFVDGSTIAISRLNDNGCNFMVLRPAMHIYSGYDDNGVEVLQNSGVYDLLAKGHTFPKRYIGMFKAYNQNGVLKSQPNRIPTGSQTIAQFQSQAKAGADDYGIWNYEDWCKENALHLAYFHHTNYETNIGIGRIDNYGYVRNIVTGFTLPLVRTDKPYGKVATVDSVGNTVNCLNFFNIEGLGEQIWEFVNGIRHDETTYYVWSDNQWSEGHEAERTFPFTVTNSSSSYVKFIKAGKYFDVIPKEVYASSTTGYCDGHWANTGGRVLGVGGLAYDGSLCGLSASSAYDGFSASNDHVGSRLAFFGEPTEVEGTNLIATLV